MGVGVGLRGGVPPSSGQGAALLACRPPPRRPPPGARHCAAPPLPAPAPTYPPPLSQKQNTHTPVDACYVAPANVPEAISVAASNLATKYGATASGDVEDMYKARAGVAARWFSFRGEGGWRSCARDTCVASVWLHGGNGDGGGHRIARVCVGWGGGMYMVCMGHVHNAHGACKCGVAVAVACGSTLHLLPLQWSNTGRCVDVFAPGERQQWLAAPCHALSDSGHGPRWHVPLHARLQPGMAPDLARGGLPSFSASGVDIYSACGGATRCPVVNNTAYTFASGTSSELSSLTRAVFLKRKIGRVTVRRWKVRPSPSTLTPPPRAQWRCPPSQAWRRYTCRSSRAPALRL